MANRGFGEAIEGGCAETDLCYRPLECADIESADCNVQLRRSSVCAIHIEVRTRMCAHARVHAQRQGIWQSTVVAELRHPHIILAARSWANRQHRHHPCPPIPAHPARPVCQPSAGWPLYSGNWGNLGSHKLLLFDLRAYDRATVVPLNRQCRLVGTNSSVLGGNN